MADLDIFMFLGERSLVRAFGVTTFSPNDTAGAELICSSSDESIVSVSKLNNIEVMLTGLKTGSAIITITIGGKVATIGVGIEAITLVTSVLRTVPQSLEELPEQTPPTSESTQITFLQNAPFYDVDGEARYFTLNDSANQQHYFWFNVTFGTNSQIEPDHPGIGHTIAIGPSFTVVDIADAFALVIDNLPASFTTLGAVFDVVTVTNVGTGFADNITQASAGITAVILAEGFPSFGYPPGRFLGSQFRFIITSIQTADTTDCLLAETEVTSDNTAIATVEKLDIRAFMITPKTPGNFNLAVNVGNGSNMFNLPVTITAVQEIVLGEVTRFSTP